MTFSMSRSAHNRLGHESLQRSRFKKVRPARPLPNSGAERPSVGEYRNLARRSLAAFCNRLFLKMLPYTSVFIWCIGLLLFAWLSLAHGTDSFIEEEIETLDVIEITGSVVKQTPRNLNFPLPTIQAYPALETASNLSGPRMMLIKPIPMQSRILLDHTAQTRELYTPVKPLKTTRPPYPRQARQQGWQGRVVVRLTIAANGTVESGTIHQSSGYQVLDDNALNAATQWTFEAAKNGAFPVATAVNIPIQFDLVE